jgi:putative transposase
MKTSTLTEEQIVQILRETDVGDQTICAICRSHSISENTFYKWRKKFGGADVSAVKRLRDLEPENARLKAFSPSVTLRSTSGTLSGEGDSRKKRPARSSDETSSATRTAKALSRKCTNSVHRGFTGLIFPTHSPRGPASSEPSVTRTATPLYIGTIVGRYS